jgi:hypothetical protein
MKSASLREGEVVDVNELFKYAIEYVPQPPKNNQLRGGGDEQ